MAGGGLLLSFCLGGVTFLLLALHESLSPLLLRLRPRAHLLVRHLLPLPLALLATLLPLLLLRPTPLLLSLSSLHSLLLLHSLLPLLPFTLPHPLTHLLLLPFFLLETLLLLHVPRPLGVERHYFSLLRLPALLCAASALLSALRPPSRGPLLARALALAIHGSWLLQTAFSSFTSAVAKGCALLDRGAGDFTVRCDGHQAYHRGMALATLQFNCHLAGIVIVAVGFYWLVGGRGAGEEGKYEPLAVIGRSSSPPRRYVLVSDDEEQELADHGGQGAVASDLDGGR